jgi:glutaredoxin
MKRLQRQLWVNFLLLAAFLLSLANWTTPVRAQTPAPANPVYIYLFWGEGCPHCAKAKPYLENLAAAYPEIQLRTYEVYYDEENQKLFSLMAEKFRLEQLAVPTIFIGEKFLQGYSEEYNSSIEAVVIQCIQDGCRDPGLGVIDTTGLVTSTPGSSVLITSSPTLGATDTPLPIQSDSTINDPSGNSNLSSGLEIPILGKLELDSKSPFISTALIALVDGFNPCSLWVLTMLLALTLHTGSRKKVFIIGIVFLTVTAGIYALFIAGLFSILKITSAMGWIRILVALIALFFALVNIKDYFWYKEGISFTIADDKKPGIYQRMRKLVDASQSFWGLVGATVVLAAGVSLVEFSCTAGFPVLWTNLLVSQKVSGLTFILLLLLYLLIYQLDEMVIFFTAVYSLKASKLEEKHGRILKLIGGMLMLTLAGVMLINPALMNSLSSSLWIFGAAFLATLLVLFIHRSILPKLGIRIGTELGVTGPSKASSHRR